MEKLKYHRKDLEVSHKNIIYFNKKKLINFTNRKRGQFYLNDPNQLVKN